MDHVRKLIRAAAEADMAGLTTTGDHVYAWRAAPLDESELPGWMVMLLDEAAEWDTIGDSPTIVRNGRLVLEGWAQGGDGLLDMLDTMAAEAETRLYGGGPTPHLDPLLQIAGPPTTQIDLPEPVSGRRTGRVRILIPIAYRTAIDDPTTIV